MCITLYNLSLKSLETKTVVLRTATLLAVAYFKSMTNEKTFKKQING